MNLFVWTESGSCISRPDTTWKMDNTQFYVPEDVHEVFYAPALVCRVDRPGKAVGLKFAGRYYGGVAPAVLLYPVVKEAERGDFPSFLAQMSCLDKTSFFPVPELERGVSGEFVVSVAGGRRFFAEVDSTRLDEALSGVTLRAYLRSGDLLFSELCAPEMLSRREDGNIEVKMSYCGLEFGFELIY